MQSLLPTAREEKDSIEAEMRQNHNQNQKLNLKTARDVIIDLDNAQ